MNRHERRTAPRTDTPADARDAGLAEVRSLVAAHPGVLSISTPAELILGPEAGALFGLAAPTGGYDGTERGRAFRS